MGRQARDRLGRFASGSVGGGGKSGGSAAGVAATKKARANTYKTSSGGEKHQRFMNKYLQMSKATNKILGMK